MPTQPAVHARSTFADLAAMLGSITVDVIERQEYRPTFPAALTRFSVVREGLEFHIKMI